MGDYSVATAPGNEFKMEVTVIRPMARGVSNFVQNIAFPRVKEEVLLQFSISPSIFHPQSSKILLWPFYILDSCSQNVNLEP